MAQWRVTSLGDHCRAAVGGCAGRSRCAQVLTNLRADGSKAGRSPPIRASQHHGLRAGAARNGTRQRLPVGSLDADRRGPGRSLNYAELAGRADWASNAHDMAVIS